MKCVFVYLLLSENATDILKQIALFWFGVTDVILTTFLQLKRRN